MLSIDNDAKDLNDVTMDTFVNDLWIKLVSIVNRVLLKTSGDSIVRCALHIAGIEYIYISPR